MTVPPRRSLRWLAYTITTPADVLIDLAENAAAHYRPFWQTKKGKRRLIDNPDAQLKAVQTRIRDVLLVPIPISPIVHGCVRRRSQVTNASVHVKTTNVSSVDVKHCYDSMTNRMVYDVFVRDVGVGSELGRVLTRLTTWKGHLPTGSPTSDALANLVMSPVDRRVEAIAAEYGLKASRYLDNIDFSGARSREAIGPTIASLQQLGLAVRHKKTFNRGPRSAHIVTGLTANSAKASQSKGDRDRIRSLTYELIVARECGENMQDREKSLHGHLVNLRRTNAGSANRLVRQLSAAGIRF